MAPSSASSLERRKNQSPVTEGNPDEEMPTTGVQQQFFSHLEEFRELTEAILTVK